jgi:hypothetical protein
MHLLAAILSAAMAITAVSPQNPGLEWNKKSTFIADQQVEFPGLVLEPGTYIVRLSENDEKRSVVEILSANEAQLLASVIAVPDHRLRPEGSEEFTFHQTKAAGPRAVQSWYFAGDLVGLEFVYPKMRAKELARQSDGHVMASGMKDGMIYAVTPNGKEVVIETAITQTARQKAQ